MPPNWVGSPEYDDHEHGQCEIDDIMSVICKYAYGLDLGTLPTDNDWTEALAKLKCDPSDKARIEVLSRACSNGHLAIAEYVIQFVDVSKYVNEGTTHNFPGDFTIAGKLIVDVCQRQLHVAKWLLHKIKTERVDHTVIRMLSYCINDELLTACRSGNMATAQWAWENGSGVLHNTLNQACEGGHLAIVQWLYELGAMYLYTALQSAYARGHLEIIDWAILHTQCVKDLAFDTSCCDGNIEKARRECTYDAKVIDHAFIGACDAGQLLTAQWLRKLGATSLNRSLKFAARAHLAVVQWLCAEGATDLYDAAIMAHCYSNGEIMRKWLYSEILRRRRTGEAMDAHRNMVGFSGNDNKRKRTFSER